MLNFTAKKQKKHPYFTAFMSFEKFQLNSEIVSEIYNNSIFILEEKQANTQSVDSMMPPHLGNYQKQILIFVSNEQHPFLADPEMDLLTAILNACKLSFNDVALCNCFKNNSSDIDAYFQKMNPTKTILFGHNPILHITGNIKEYHPLQLAKGECLLSQDLSFLLANPDSKKILWDALRVLFKI